MFENKEFEGIYYTRFIASYVKVKGGFNGDEFRRWLRSLKINGQTMTEDIIWDIYNIATNGKLELETNVRNFLKED
jgi:hypothetical protein